jgi:hypothetical protein
LMNSFWILKCTSKVWESTRACVMKYIRVWLPSQAPRGGLASQTHACMGTLRQQNGLSCNWATCKAVCTVHFYFYHRTGIRSYTIAHGSDASSCSGVDI